MDMKSAIFEKKKKKRKEMQGKKKKKKKKKKKEKKERTIGEKENTEGSRQEKEKGFGIFPPTFAYYILTIIRTHLFISSLLDISTAFFFSSLGTIKFIDTMSSPRRRIEQDVMKL